MKRTSDLNLIVFFTALTFLLTVVVVLSWEKFLLPPFFSWVESKYPGPANAETRVMVQQRVEHFFISIAVDIVVVTLLLRVVRRQHRRVVESEERYRALFEHAGDGIAVVRASDFRLVEANGKFCETAGCRPEEVAGTDIRRLLRPDGDGQGEGLARLLGGEEGEGEFVIRATPGAGAATPVSASFSTLSAGGETWVMLIIRDLSARRRLEAEKGEMQHQLYQTSKLASLGELSAGVAHEINNPLNGIINFAQLLKDEPTARTDFERQMIDGIIDEGGRIAQIVRGLLSFARPDSHGPARAHVHETVQTSIALFGRQLEKDGVSVRVEVEPNLPPVRADGSRLRQVVVNMISNAHHALRARGDDGGSERVFRISARRAGLPGAERVLLEFYDSGVGIPAADLDRVFDPFFTTRRDAGGTGLGLSISFGIVRDYGGTIRVESREGEFTRFTVELPAADTWEADYV